MLHAVISTSSSGDTTLVAAVTGKRIVVHQYTIVAQGAVNVKFKSGSTDITGAMGCDSTTGIAAGLPPTPADDNGGVFKTELSEALVLNLSGAVSVGGHLSYSLDVQ